MLQFCCSWSEPGHPGSPGCPPIHILSQSWNPPPHFLSHGGHDHGPHTKIMFFILGFKKNCNDLAEIFLPSHFWLLHGRDSLSKPGQPGSPGSPPIHFRLQSWNPPPQVLLHVGHSQPPHSAHARFLHISI